jgi:hypothetical protein
MRRGGRKGWAARGDTGRELRAAAGRFGPTEDGDLNGVLLPQCGTSAAMGYFCRNGVLLPQWGTSVLVRRPKYPIAAEVPHRGSTPLRKVVLGAQSEP